MCCCIPEKIIASSSGSAKNMLHGKTGSRHLLKLGTDRLVDLEELGDATIDADSLALVKLALDVGLGNALLMARADNAVFR